MINHKRCSSVSNHHSLTYTYSDSMQHQRQKHRISQPLKESIYHSKAKSQNCSLSHSFFLSNQNSQTATGELKRKNSIVLSKKKIAWTRFEKETSKKKEEMTPFQKRKLTEKNDLRQKIKDIQNKKTLSFILEESVKNWLVISELKPDPKTSVSLYLQQLQVHPNEPDFIDQALRSQKKQEYPLQNQNKSLQKYDHHNMEIEGKVLDVSYLRNRQKNKTEIDIKKKESSLQNLKIFNCTSVDIKKEEKLNSQYLKNNKVLDKKNISKKKLTLKNLRNKSKVLFPEEQKKKISIEAFRCLKVDFVNKINSRPQTAIVKVPKTHFWTKPIKRSPENHESLRQMTGWQDLTDSFDRQILF